MPGYGLVHHLIFNREPSQSFCCSQLNSSSTRSETPTAPKRRCYLKPAPAASYLPPTGFSPHPSVQFAPISAGSQKGPFPETRRVGARSVLCVILSAVCRVGGGELCHMPAFALVINSFTNERKCTCQELTFSRGSHSRAWQREEVLLLRRLRPTVTSNDDIYI